MDAGAQGLVAIGNPGKVPGEPFGGGCSIGGVWYTANDFPAEYTGVYYHADFVKGWIRLFRFDASDVLTEVEPMLELSKCKDFVVNRGHYFGTDRLTEEPGLGDGQKRDLIEFLKTF